MEIDENISDENWDVLKSFFPSSWEELAVLTGANSRLRGFDSVEALMRTLLMHIAHGYSLRETVVRAKSSGIADISDVALLKRLKKSKDWFRELCVSLLCERGAKLPKVENPLVIRLIDGTIVKEPGQTGSQWRILYSLRLPELQCDYFNLTSNTGIGTGETFCRIPVEKGEHIIGDRAYSNPRGVEHIANRKAYSLVRLNQSSLPLHSKQGDSFPTLKKLKTLKEVGPVGEWSVYVKGEKGQIEGRLCAVRKTETAIRLAHKKLKERASKRQKNIKPETFEFAKYITVFTTFPRERFSASDILDWYRVRWQVELMFKRLKSLAALGHLPKYDDESSQAWLLGKLFVALLTEKLVHCARDVSPWGYELETAAQC